MAAPSITSFWKTYSSILGSDINRKMGYTSKVYSMFKEQRQEWKEQQGHVMQHVQFERLGINPDADADWVADDNAAYPEAIKSNSTSNYGGASTGDAVSNKANNIDPPVDTVTFDKTTRGFGLLQKAFQSQDISIEDLRAAAVNEQQTAAMVGLLTDLAREYWVRLCRDELCRISGTKLVATGTATNATWLESTNEYDAYDSATANRWNQYGFGGTYTVATDNIDTPDKQDTSILTWRHIEDLIERILQEGADEYATVYADGMPVPYLITDLKSAQRLKTDGSTNGVNVRTDIRESSMADSLLKGLGVHETYKGVAIIPDRNPSRFTITGDSADSTGVTGSGVWTEQPFYINDSSTNKRIINASYRSAAFTESYLVMPRALATYTPRPNYSGVGAVKTVPQDYSGEYGFETIQHKTDNPFRGHGFFQGKIAQACVALDKDLIFTIRHRIGEGTAA